MQAVEAESLSRRLRAATAVLHQRAEDGMDIQKRSSTLEGYVHLLRRMESFYRTFEPVLVKSLEGRVPEEFLAARTPRIRQDLDGLDAKWQPLPSPEVPQLTGNQALGGLYVLEGASLGGQVIARHLAANLGLDGDRGASFFANKGMPIGPRWKAFRVLLDEAEDFDALEEGATQAFLAFEKGVVLDA